jgi:hypothetical protein
MSSLKNRYMKQTCVYWAPGNADSGGLAYNNYGQPVYSDPVEKNCRWEDIAVTFLSTKGTEETSKAVVFVDDIVVGGLLLLGDLSSSLDLVDPRNNEGAWEIRQVESIPNRLATITYTWAYL